MSSSLEVQAPKYGESRYGEETQGMLEAGKAPASNGNDTQAPAKTAHQDDEGVLPVILEDYLERAGVM
jgi:hypothetical protein